MKDPKRRVDQMQQKLRELQDEIDGAEHDADEAFPDRRGRHFVDTGGPSNRDDRGRTDDAIAPPG